MKILFDSQMFDKQVYGGISRYFVNLISALERRAGFDAELSVLFTKNYYLKDRKLKFDNFLGRAVLSEKKRISKWNKNYSRYRIAKNDFDIFHPTYFHPYFLKLLKRPFVITVHDMIYELYPDYFNSADLTAQYKKQVINAASHVIAISQTTKNDLIRLLHVPEEKISVVYHGHTSIKNDKMPDVSLPAKYLLFVGGRDDYKNFETFARGAAILMQGKQSLYLVCAGGSNFTLEEEDFLQQLNINERALQYDVADDLLYWLYKGAEAFVYPSLYEGFGLPILEAYESGCPVILSRTPSFVEVAADAAIYFDAENPEEIAESIKSVLDNVELREQLVRKGQGRLAEFTMERCIAGTIDVYKNCLKK